MTSFFAAYDALCEEGTATPVCKALDEVADISVPGRVLFLYLCLCLSINDYFYYCYDYKHCHFLQCSLIRINCNMLLKVSFRCVVLKICFLVLKFQKSNL